MMDLSPIDDVKNLLETQSRQIDLLEERLADKLIALEDVGWLQINGSMQKENGPDLETLGRIVPNLRDMAAMHPLHVRGAQLRHAYIFGRGLSISGIEESTQRLIDNAYNQEALFSVQAYETYNLERFCAGNFFVKRNEKTNILTVIPLEQIKGEVTDPDDTSRIRYVLREWSDGNDVLRKWYPIARYKRSLKGSRGKKATGKIRQYFEYGGKRVPVAQDEVMYHDATHRQAGWAYGIPDSMAAAAYSVTYSEYIKDNAKYVKALQQIAWAISTASKKGTQNAAVQMAQPGSGVGATAVFGSGNSLQGVGVPSAQVNFNNGQPIAALVAASLGVPVIALLSSPGATGGSYGAAQTLDSPTIKGFQAAQDSSKILLEEIIRDMGSPNAIVTFPALEQDPAYREVQSIVTAKEAGLLHQDEAREGVFRVMDVEKLHDEMPPDNPDFQSAAQGRQGDVPGGFNQGDTADDGHGEE